MLRRTLFLHPDAPAAPAPPAVPPVTPERRADDFTTRMIAQHGTLDNAMRATATRMFEAEDRVAAVSAERDAFKAKVPGEGDLVIPKAEAKEFKKVVDLGMTPDDIVAAVKERDALKGKDSARTLADQGREAGTAHGFDPEATAAMVQAKGLHVEAKDVQTVEKGKTVTKKIYHVRPSADANAPLVPLTDFAAKLPAFEQRALKPTAAAPTPTGTEWPVHRPAAPEATDGKSIVDSYISKANAPKRQAPQPAAAAS